MSHSNIGTKNSVTSSILHKQDLFWENIIMAYETAIEELRQEESRIYQYIFELRLLIHAITTFNIIKLLNQGNASNLINQLLQLKCICSQCAEKEEPIKVEAIDINLGCKDIKAMAKIKELITCEKQLIDEVNILRIKDMALTHMKLNVDKLMKMHFPNIVSSVSDTISDMPKEIIIQLREVGALSSNLNNMQQQNKRLESNLYDLLPSELAELRRKNNFTEDQMNQMSRKLVIMLSKRDLQMTKEIFKVNRCSHKDLMRLVKTKQNEVDILKLSLDTLKSLK